MFKILRWKWIIISLLSIIIFVVSIVYYCNITIENASRGKLYDDVNKIPYNDVAILLGTSKYLSHNILNPYYSYRITAAVSLLKAHKVKYIIISGDNSTVSYNEPYKMRTDLMKQGIDSSVIYLDFAGFRTFDSMIRLKEIFGQDSVTVISQQFHNQRALYIAKRENIYAIGFNAKDVSSSLGLKVQIREKLARVKVFIDYLISTKPHFLGKKIPLPK